MRRLFALIMAGTAALMLLCSCEINIGTRHDVSIDAYLTAYYAGGLPSVTSQGTYDLHSERITDRQIEELFYDLSRTMQPGYGEAVLEIEFYDWLDNYMYTRTFDFWWEYYDYATGDGYYAWEERK